MAREPWEQGGRETGRVVLLLLWNTSEFRELLKNSVAIAGIGHCQTLGDFQ
ncbi:MAG: hypothetical protein ACFB0G_02395 [Leptolyngbyaceae cyanobacterium]